MFFRLFQPFLWSGGNVVLYFVTGRMHPGTLDVVVDWQRCVKAEASGSLDFCFFDQETGCASPFLALLNSVCSRANSLSVQCRLATPASR